MLGGLRHSLASPASATFMLNIGSVAMAIATPRAWFAPPAPGVAEIAGGRMCRPPPYNPGTLSPSSLDSKELLT